MTAIAYRNGVMAADTLNTFDDVKLHAPKIIKHKGYLLGAAGTIPSLDALVRWYFQALGKPTRPKMADGYDMNMIVVTPAGCVQHWTHSGQYEAIRNRFWAVGSGAAACMAAMEMGASAPEAVAAAIKWATGCGGRVTVRKL